MTMQIVAAITLIGLVAIGTLLLNTGVRREIARRAGLTFKEQELLREEDATWSQRFGF